MPCSSMSRIGPALGKGMESDGGKTLCDADAVLQGPDCLVVSVGLNADTRFEAHLHSMWPRCEIVGIDGTLNAAKTAAVHESIRHLPINFNSTTHKLFAHRRHVNLLKIDCDGCEFASLRAWLANICTEQVVVEVHRFRGKIFPNVINMHKLMMGVHGAGYRIGFVEPNARYPKLGSEYTLVRNRTCPRSASGALPAPRTAAARWTHPWT